MAKTLGDILKERKQKSFVGREDHLEFFRQNLEMTAEDENRSIIVNVFGQGGVGKSTLLQKYRMIADEQKSYVAWTDEAIRNVPDCLNKIVVQLGKAGILLKNFAETYELYIEKRQEVESVYS